MIDTRRFRHFTERTYSGGPVVYWMNRDQRVDDNWALLQAQQFAARYSVPLAVAFCLPPRFLDSTIRQSSFMVDGLKHLSDELESKGIPFILLQGDPGDKLPKFVLENGVGLVVADFSPLRIHRDWLTSVADQVAIPVVEVDAHNIVPCWMASDKREFAAYTFRPKISRLLSEFLTEFPPLENHKLKWGGRLLRPDWTSAAEFLEVDRLVEPVESIRGGGSAALERLRNFLGAQLQDYAELRNDPNADAQSQLSPYIHFGQISAQRIALNAISLGSDSSSMDAFLDELIVRRELSDNFCYYAESYDRFDSFPNWAKRTLDEHRHDERIYLYNISDFEVAETHDELWNAAQLEMVHTGKMHGYMRMYWAKKILEWSPSPEEAMAASIYLNDKYSLDGCDPNGYSGIAWSIGGVHDRAWFERPIYGKIRYMSESGCRRKFDVDAYISRVMAFRDLRK